MDTSQQTLNTLFDQLGLDSSDDAIEQFIQTHRLPAEVKISDADFWSEGQRAFLKDAYKLDNHWNPVVDNLNALLHD